MQCDQIIKLLKSFMTNFLPKVGKLFGELLGYFEKNNF